MITINMQYFGNKGAASGKSGGAGGGAQSTAEKFSSLQFPEDQKMLTESFVTQGVPKEISEDFAGSIARDKNLKSGRDGTTAVDKLTPKQKIQVENAYHAVLKEYGYSGEISLYTKKVAGTKSKLKYGGSKGASYETIINYSYRKN